MGSLGKAGRFIFDRPLKFTPPGKTSARRWTWAFTGNFHSGQRQLQAQVGGNCRLRDGLSLDFGVVAGRFAASPRLGAQLGVSLDF